MKPKKRIYVCGPLRGHPQNYRPAFDEAEAWLASQGWDVVNPAKTIERHGTPDEIDAEHDLLAARVKDELQKEIANCDAIYLMRECEKSVFAIRELKTAMEYGLEIVVQEES